jgi:3',5'-cyclic AMP phosphodiesterase CpdA
VRIAQVSDLHFGRHSVPEYLAAVAKRIAETRYDLVVVAGDLTQRHRIHQLKAAKAWLDAARATTPVLTVAGNHDVGWWWKVAGVGPSALMYRRYRRWISPELQPRIQLPGVTVVALNSCHGVRPYTLTRRLKDISIVGAITAEQWASAWARFSSAPAGDLKVLVFHHNLLRGDLSHRWGLATRARAIGDAMATGADLVLNGHDHQTRIEVIESTRRMVVSASTTLSDRRRGGLPAAFQEIEVTPRELRIRACVWSDDARDFTPRADRVFAR